MKPTRPITSAPIDRRVRPATDALHIAVCQAVALLNRAPEVMRCVEGREASYILRQALADYADTCRETTWSATWSAI